MSSANEKGDTFKVTLRSHIVFPHVVPVICQQEHVPVTDYVSFLSLALRVNGLR